MNEDQHITLTTTPTIVRGLLAIVRRAAMSEFEFIQVEIVFGGWFREIEDQSKQTDALNRLAALARDQPPAESVADTFGAMDLDEGMSRGVDAAGDVFDGDGDGGPLESPPDEASGPPARESS